LFIQGNAEHNETFLLLLLMSWFKSINDRIINTIHTCDISLTKLLLFEFFLNKR